MRSHFLTGCLAVWVGVAGAGCAGPAIQGIFADRDFAIVDDTPKILGSAADPILVFFQADDVARTLRTVSLTLPALAHMPRGEAVAVAVDFAGKHRPQIEVIEGVLERVAQNDGSTLLTSGDDRAVAVAVAGSVTVDSAGRLGDDIVSGTFSVDLDDGGYLAGRFVSAP